ncbi:hypothetical protein [Kitasatospora sp. NPDC091276]|uniref:hypothetical protein n=1 Tax=Kitasatospora sp. NPDC091276 TaxID=3155300 RepID=UPI003429AF87
MSAATVLAMSLGISAVSATDGGSSAGGAGADLPPVAVEDFTHPGADRVLADTGVVLKRGDGHITLVPCDGTPGLLRVFARDLQDFCLRMTGDKGYLSLEVPRITGVRGNDYNVSINTTAGSSTTSFTVKKNTWTPVGSSTDPEGRDYTLMEVTATK